MLSLKWAIVLVYLFYTFCNTSGEIASSPAANRCQSYCSRSYPEHTYPVPDDHAACTRGCRLSQLEASLSNSQDDKKKVTVSCNDTCIKAYASEKQLIYPCQVGCSAQPLEVKVPEDDVWILSTLYEIMFLRKLAQELHWKEDTTVNKPLSVSKSTLIFVDYVGDDFSSKADFSGRQLSISIDDEKSAVSYKEYRYSSLHSVLRAISKPTGTTTPSPSSAKDQSLFGLSCSDWESLLDVLIVGFIILFFLVLLDHLFLPRKNDIPKKNPVVKVHNDNENQLKKPLYIQDSNRYAYAPQEGKYVEGTLVVINRQ